MTWQLRHEFELGKSFEAGVALIGSEARALREGPADITDAWVEIRRGEAWVQGMRVPPLAHSFLGHEEKRARKLLLHRAQIDELLSAQDQDRMTLVATKLYFKGGRVKLELCVARGNIPYSAVIQPRPLSRNHRGTSGSIDAVHKTRVFPNEMSTDPGVLLVNPNSIEIGRS